MTGASVSPVGQCYIFGRRLYDGDAHIIIIQNDTMVTEVCSDCAKITCRGKRASIVYFANSCSREEMPLCGRGWADDAGEEDADCPDYDSFMSVLEQE